MSTVLNLGNVRPLITNEAILAAIANRLSEVVTGALSLTDSGKIIYATGDISIPPIVFFAGNSLVISNSISSAIEITSALPIRIAGQLVTGNVQLGAYGVATLLFDESEVKVSGEGLSAAFDSNAVAFFTAAGITTSTVKLAVSNFVLGLKSSGIWDKMLAIYPMIQNTGGNSIVSASYNLKNPAANRLTYSGAGTMTASNSGLISDGFISATTGLNLTTTTANSLAFGAYLVAGTGADVAIGAWLGSEGVAIYPKNGGNMIADNQYNSGSGRVSVANGVTAAGYLYSCSRTSSTLSTAYRGATSLGTATGAQGSLVSDTFQLFRRGSSGTTGAMTLGLTYIANGLSGAEISALTALTSTLNTDLGR